MNPEARERWINNFDPLQYLGGVQCPILFLNGSNDFAYPIHYTTDAGEWQKREWKTAGAELSAGKISARLPAERPLVCYLSVTDERGIRVSTAHVELPAGK
jgi:hypothetical protein